MAHDERIRLMTGLGVVVAVWLIASLPIALAVARRSEPRQPLDPLTRAEIRYWSAVIFGPAGWYLPGTADQRLVKRAQRHR